MIIGRAYQEKSADIAFIAWSTDMAPTSSDPGGHIEVSINGAVGLIVLANPARRNALTLAMWRALPAAIASLEADEAVRVIGLAGAGDDFSTGADIAEFDSLWNSPGSPYEAATVAAFAALRQATKPTLALVTGACMGGAVGLAAACDIRLAATLASFAIPAARLGLAYPPDSVADLVALIGAGRTRDLMFTGRSIDATTALAIGLVERLFHDDEFEERTAVYIDTVARLAPLTHRATKTAVEAVVRPGEVARGLASEAADACFASADYVEGRAAFAARRTPTFKGS